MPCFRSYRCKEIIHSSRDKKSFCQNSASWHYFAIDSLKCRKHYFEINIIVLINNKILLSAFNLMRDGT